MSRWLEAARRAQQSARSVAVKTDKTDRTRVSSVLSVLSGGDKPKIPSIPSPATDAYAVRAVILEHDDGLAREEAEAIAAREQGYADAFAYADAVVANWQREIEAAPAPSLDAAHWEELKRVAIEFLASPVAADAARAGWSAKVLFGVVPTDDGQCLAVGAVFRQLQEGPLFAFDSEVALYRHEDDSWHHREITEFDATGTVLLWQATEPTRSD